MEISNIEVIQKMRELFEAPQSLIERDFSPYFYQYFKRFKYTYRFNGYLHLCRSITRMTQASGATVLDLGCGFGVMATILRLYGAKEVVGYDQNLEKIELFQKLLSYLDSGIQKVTPVLGDSSNILYPDQSFDVVIANESFSHFRDLSASIQEADRVLKPGGTLFVRDGNNSLFLLGRIQRRRFWKRIEEGPVDPSWFRSTDLALPYREIRKKMILEKSPQMDPERVKVLANKTAGMFGDEIFDAVEEFEKKWDISNSPEFHYRNPITGEFPEKEINPFWFKKIFEARGFNVSFAPYCYAESWRYFEMIVKRLINWTECHLPVVHLFLSPGFTLLGIKRGITN